MFIPPSRLRFCWAGEPLITHGKQRSIQNIKNKYHSTLIQFSACKDITRIFMVGMEVNECFIRQNGGASDGSMKPACGMTSIEIPKLRSMFESG